MPFETIDTAAAPVWLWTRPEEVEPAALTQLRAVANLPWIHHHVAVMPDVHLGKGATVGSVVAMRDAVSPAAVGAGRRMSRRQARRTFTLADLETQTAGVECRKDDGVLDEIPGAYKDVRDVLAHQRDLVEVVAELRQVMCVKG